MKNLRISLRLGLTLALAFLLAIVSASALLLQLHSVQRQYDGLLAGPIAAQLQARVIQADLKTQVQEWKNVLLRGSDADSLEKYQVSLFKYDESVSRSATELRDTVKTAELRGKITEFIAVHQKLGNGYRAALKPFIASGGREFAAADEAVKGQDRPPMELIDTIVAELDRNVTEAQMAIRADINHWQNLFVIAASVVGVIFVTASILLVRGIVRPLHKTVLVLNRVAQMDFSAHLDISSRDEIGQMAAALNEMVRKISKSMESLAEIRNVADTVALAAQQLSTASEEISSGVQEQASNLEETASSLEEITSTVKQNADNALQANQLALGAREVAEKGGAVVDQAIEGMAEINKSSKKIADIITAIDEIAFQTNLLALNAAVEAARAGEQGRGFAVVAGEVRNLAQRSAGAAKEIKGLIQDSVRKVETGSELVNKSGHTLQEIVTSVKRVTDIIAEIAAASREQSSGIDQVSKAVAQMDTVTQANASQTEELSGTAESLSGQAQQLQQLVAKFRLGEQGESQSMPAVHNTPAAPATNGHAKRPAVKRSEPAQHSSHSNGRHHELDLVGAASGPSRLNGHFEEF